MAVWLAITLQTTSTISGLKCGCGFLFVCYKRVHDVQVDRSAMSRSARAWEVVSVYLDSPSVLYREGQLGHLQVDNTGTVRNQLPRLQINKLTPFHWFFEDGSLRTDRTSVCTSSFLKWCALFPCSEAEVGSGGGERESAVFPLFLSWSH